MKLYHKGSGNPICNKLRFAKGIFGKLKGLMLERKESFDYCLLFDFGSEERIGASIHMMFVFFPIYAVYLDSNKKVVDTAILQPFALNYTPKAPARYLIEMPIAFSEKVSLGNELDWK